MAFQYPKDHQSKVEFRFLREVSRMYHMLGLCTNSILQKFYVHGSLDQVADVEMKPCDESIL
jgi:hypothetical protein